jgi:hypothetical protein
MQASKHILVFLIMAAGLVAGALAAAWHDGRVSLAGWSESRRLVATPVCNPNDVTGIDLDGELPGGG